MGRGQQGRHATRQRAGPAGPAVLAIDLRGATDERLLAEEAVGAVRGYTTVSGPREAREPGDRSFQEGARRRGAPAGKDLAVCDSGVDVDVVSPYNSSPAQARS